MTKSYKATHFWMYRYDKRYTLFVYQIYKKVITKPTTTQNQSVKISAIRGKNLVLQTIKSQKPNKINPLLYCQCRLLYCQCFLQTKHFCSLTTKPS